MTPALDIYTTALVLIDLQKGIVTRDTKPHSAADVVKRSAQMARRFREMGGTVVLVHVGYSADDRDRLKPLVDSAPTIPTTLPLDWSELVPDLEQQPSDIVVLKRQWGAFYGTQLDLQLRRRRIFTIVLAGIATNLGVESTARDAWERNYQLVFAEDAMASMSAEWHDFSIKNIFPRIGMVRSTEEILGALQG